MARGRLNILQKVRENSGFGENTAGRFFNKDGFANVKKKGVNIFNRQSWYHTMLNLPARRFIIYLLCCYIAINFVFAIIYYLIGIEHLTGIDKSSPIKEFIDVYFFSSQTFTTVGYGRISPVGFWASMVATFEAFIGLLTFSIATGLFYGRFSRPRAYLQFSENALIAPYKDGTALMFRLAPYKNNALTDAHVILSVAIELEENGERRTRFFNLTTELSHIDSLSLNWTVVHHITDTSPFYRFTQDDFIHTDMEIIVQVRAFDDVFSDTVVQRTSYINSEIIYGAKFLPMYFPNRTDKTTVLDLAQLNTFEKVELPNVAS